MNHNLHIVRRYDPAIDRSLREWEAEAHTAPRIEPPTIEQAMRESDEAAKHAAEGLAALAAYVVVIIYTVAAVLA